VAKANRTTSGGGDPIYRYFIPIGSSTSLRCAECRIYKGLSRPCCTCHYQAGLFFQLLCPERMHSFARLVWLIRAELGSTRLDALLLRSNSSKGCLPLDDKIIQQGMYRFPCIHLATSCSHGGRRSWQLCNVCKGRIFLSILELDTFQ
jgi:hypothetical protein